METVAWGDIEDSAKRVFDVWVGKPELRWAERSWAILDKKGLTSYTNELERTKVIARLAALAAIYKGFCAVAFDEITTPWYEAWLDELEFNRVRLVQLAGPEFEPSVVDENTLAERALGTLISALQPEVYHALVEGFGDVDRLFVYLWLSNQGEEEYRYEYEEEWDEEEYEYKKTVIRQKTDREIEAEVLNDLSGYDFGNKMAAYQWLGDEVLYAESDDEEGDQNGLS